MSTINNFPELKKVMSEHGVKNLYLFIGNGPKLQYQDINNVKSEVSKALVTLNVRNDIPWMAIFGGDTFVESKPDLGSVMHFVKQKFNPVLVAVQCWGEVDSHVDYVWQYKEEREENGRKIYGGVDNGRAIGGTNVYLGDDVREILTAVINVDARGRVGPKEIEFAKANGMNVIDVTPLLPRHGSG